MANIRRKQVEFSEKSVLTAIEIEIEIGIGIKSTIKSTWNWTVSLQLSRLGGRGYSVKDGFAPYGNANFDFDSDFDFDPNEIGFS